MNIGLQANSACWFKSSIVPVITICGTRPWRMACGIQPALAQRRRRNSRTGWLRFLVPQYEGPPCPAVAQPTHVAQPRRKTVQNGTPGSIRQPETPLTNRVALSKIPGGHPKCSTCGL